MISSPPLRLRQVPPGLGRNCWRLLSDRIAERRMTEIEHGLRRPVTLHQADDGIHWFCHEIVPELNGLSPSACLVFRRDIRTWRLVFEAIPQLHRLPWSMLDTTTNHFITKALAKQSVRFSPVNFWLLSIALLNPQRRMNDGKAQRSGKRRRKCGIIVMVSHCITSGQDTGWRQDKTIKSV